ncbi:sulfate adenylyltransferase subunit 1 [Inhella inkyongensis]|uniref:sulfate adenylyltransferase n=1 Tax=Inhella inkyongensis TaxID=392593 RepID=A0A840S406_9BURK|nr:GTP-binding protein [Inhella inkyongensis]MBB5203554.1 sulfate adenylyltransferase subunit 1 [Inhella inkyongensis]
MQALRFLTAGSVDDGKSTLIGRLLFDSQAILADQLDVLERRAAGKPVDLSLLTDGLEAEREQGITIDVAYRYFATKTRKFIIADAPGHEQYTRNMVTAAAGSDAAVVLVDITKLDLSQTSVGLLPQTRRHSLLAQLLRVPSLVFAINKIDALERPGEGFAKVKAALESFAQAAGLEVAAIVPVSALRGDNVTQPLDAPWWQGPSLLQVLEGLPCVQERSDAPLSLPIQYVQKDAFQSEGAGFQPRVLWGRIAHGAVQVGDEIEVLPSRQKAVVAGLRRAAEDVQRGQAGESVGVILDRQLDVSRGDWLAHPGKAVLQNRFPATLAWLDTEPAKPGRKYWVRHGNRWVQARIAAIDSVLDIHSLQPQAALELQVNTIGRVQMEVQHELPVEPFEFNRVGGALIVVDPASHRTSGALLVDLPPAPPAEEDW